MSQHNGHGQTLIPRAPHYRRRQPHRILAPLDAVSFHAEPLRGEEVEVAGRYQLLTRAIEDQRTIETDYYTASRQALSRRKIDPYHLRLFDGAWYCIGYCHERREVRTFALDRMTGLGVTGESFKVPADFSVEEYLAGSLAIERGEPRRVVIEFDHSEAPYIRGRQWHHSQTLEELSDGTLRMTLTRSAASARSCAG